MKTRYKEKRERSVIDMEWKIGAAYVRVSTDDQVEYSPESQLRLIQDYAKREGYIIPPEYIYQDEGISGKRADRRPAFMLMVATAKEKEHPFDTIFVWKYSRFARNQEESLVYKNLLKRNGVTVRSISEPSSDDNPFSGLIESIISWMDEYYVINLANEVRRGMTEKARRGEAMGTAPFGYTVKDKVLTPNENAEIVRYIFEQFAAGKGSRTLALELGDKGIRTRRGKIPENRWVDYILRNPVYIGKTRWSTDGHANYSRENQTNKHVMIVDGKHAPIIDMELWEKAQERLKERKPLRYIRKGKEVYMLKGLVRCGACGSTLTLMSSAYPSLQCHKYAHGQCGVSHAINMRKAEAAVIKYLQEAIEREAFTFEPQEPKREMEQDFSKAISLAKSRLDRAKRAYLDGIFTEAEYKEIKAETEENLARLENQPSRAELRPNMKSYKRRVLGVLSILESAEKREEEKNAALRSIIDHITYIKPDTFDVYFLP